MSAISLDWSAAEVENAKLRVPLDGDIPKGWRKSFARTVALLGGGEWGEIEVKKNSVRVANVEPGSEDKLRHHLEAVVTQANAEHEPDEFGDADDDSAPDAVQSDPDDEDAEMTRRFRSLYR
jgi:hypothetical protein